MARSNYLSVARSYQLDATPSNPSMPPPGWKTRTSKVVQRSATKPVSSKNSLSRVLNAKSNALSAETDPDVRLEKMGDNIRQALDIPDLSTRGGLKRIHNNFDTIFPILDTTFKEYSDNMNVRSGVVVVYERMCSDSILCRKLLEKGFLDQVVQLLPHQTTRNRCLRVIQTITWYGTPGARTSIMEKHFGELLELLRNHPDDQATCERVVAIVVHCLNAVSSSSKDPEQVRLWALVEPHMASVTDLLTEAALREGASHHLVSHYICLAANQLSEWAHKTGHECHSLQRILVAGMRSDNWVIRSTCIQGMAGFCKTGCGAWAKRRFDLNFMTYAPAQEPRLFKILQDYGLNRCHVQSQVILHNKLSNAFVDYKTHRNLCQLGLELSQLATECDITQIEPDPETWGRIHESWMPFDYWMDALHLSANAIRQRGNVEEQDGADILDCSYHIGKEEFSKAADVASKALQRTPDLQDQHVFFHYVIACKECCGPKAFKSVLNGLACSWNKTTKFLRLYLLRESVRLALKQGVYNLRNQSLNSRHLWEEGVASLSTGLKNARAFLEESPPDDPDRVPVITEYIAHMFLVLGPKISRDLQEIQEALDNLKEADDFARAMKVPRLGNCLRQSNELIIKLYPESLPIADTVIKQFDNSEPQERPVYESFDKLQAELIRWLDQPSLRRKESGMEERAYTLATVPGGVEMYVCLYCRNPSAVLRKCAGCSKARYCNKNCQKYDWEEHKKSCQRVDR